MATSPSINAESQGKLLEDALNLVKVQSFQMKKCLDNNNLMDALKNCSTMLAELRTSSLTPKNYYELYMAIFDSLRHLSTFLNEAHTSGRHHLAELYELVQYAGNIIPRLYLMITVGSVYMSIKDAPVKEIMKDMMEMARGVQHPTRGLFLRYYLGGATRDYLPTGTSEGPEGNLNDSIQFTLTNFMEMNKLWVRLQHQGHSREREKREMERKELKILIGSNLVKLSQLEGVTLNLYQETILPGILEQVVSCKDLIAQEYLLEAIIQVFEDDFHLRTLDQLLSALAKLNPRVSVKQIVISLIDRLAAYAAREAENGNEVDENGVKRVRGIPEDVKLFEVFWEQIVELIKARPDISIQDITALLVSLAHLSLSCYPDELEYVDQIIGFTKEKMIEYEESPDLHTANTTSSLLSLLLAPVNAYPTALTLLSLTNYQSLLELQPYSTRRSVSHAIISSILKKETVISTPEEVDGVLELCNVLVRDQKDASIGVSFALSGKSPMDDEDAAEEQGWVARMIHLFRNEDPDEQIMLLLAARKQFGDGGDRIRFTFPPMIIEAVKLARKYNMLESRDEEWNKKCTTLFKFIHQLIGILYNKAECHDLSLRLFLLAAQSADECGFEEIAYEFFVQAFSVYEESISESKAQFQAILLIVGTLQTSRGFKPEEYDTLITKCVLHSGKLLKKPDQCRAVYHCSHLFWGTDVPGKDEKEDNMYRNGQRVLETLQRALKIADACLDSVTNVELFVEVLNRYIYFFERQVEEVTPKHLNGIIDLINSNVASMENDSLPKTSNSSALITPEGNPIDFILKHFKLTMIHLQHKKELAAGAEVAPNYDEIDSSITIH
ncbi:vacuolar protein sorting-associated protein 35 [Basidiobolus meristosporus CBS 931.73]|uniref:Vacuolar protein sorting-associated protein 35 n=1 Tax=Basidiobolus meristosporus CBS 931.73 TaxID=1314790 RepID=A0A1Y1Y1C0_9FUNG|nr:vacuolar protein sorting-associated protein 35 [Basidiobolus meristosporus CBS 931.73]|eukprot:ORX91800.1 vacuolar protein sorting-associated protein 35 [Basidiobolus meristosporus CBS 931.73]